MNPRTPQQIDFDQILSGLVPPIADPGHVKADALQGEFVDKDRLLRLFGTLSFTQPLAGLPQNEWKELLNWCGEELERQRLAEKQQERQQEQQQRRAELKEQARPCFIL
jgi:hypothetical protein